MRPDGKAQVTVEYGEDGKPLRLDAVVVSAQHSPVLEHDELCWELTDKVLFPALQPLPPDEDTKILINPSGRFVLGGPEADTGLTGRKLMEDTYLDSSPVADFQNDPVVKSIGNSTTTPRDLERDEDVKIILYVLADSVARRLREQGLKGRTIHFSVRDNSLFSFTRQKTLGFYTNLTEEIAGEALSLFREHYQWKRPVRSIGISVSDLEAGTILQSNQSVFAMR